MGISMSSVTALRAVGHEVVHLRDERLMRLSDASILDKARHEESVVLTCDVDFGSLLATGMEESPSVIIIRLRDQRPGTVTPRIIDVAAACEMELRSGCVITIEESRHRIRRLPIQNS